MFLFSRLLTLTGPQDEISGWANEITAAVNGKSDIGVSCWAALYGQPLGTLAWSAAVENRSQLVNLTASLGGDSAYGALAARAADWVTTPGQDSLRRPLNPPATPPAGPAPLGAVAQITTAVATAGRMMDAMAWGLDIADYTSGLSGSPVTFFSDVYGQFGGVAWVSVQPDMAATDSMDERLNGDAGYTERIGKLGDLFEAGSGNVALFVRVA